MAEFTWSMMQSRIIDSFLDAAYHGRLNHVKEIVATYGLISDHLHPSPYCEAITLICQNRENKSAYEIIEFLLENGASPDFVNQDKCTALMYTTLNNNTILSELLLRHGANPNFSGPKHTSPLVWSAMLQSSEMAQLLFSYGANIKTTHKTYAIGSEQHHFLTKQQRLYHSRENKALSSSQSAFKNAQNPRSKETKPPLNDALKAEPLSLKKRPKTP